MIHLCNPVGCSLFNLHKLIIDHYNVAENYPIMPSLCLVLFNAYYAQNHTGIIGTSLHYNLIYLANYHMECCTWQDQRIPQNTIRISSPELEFCLVMYVSITLINR